jgi:acetyl esterase
MGMLDMDESWCRFVANGAGTVVVSVDYRLAPEFPFPIPAEDCYAALRWVFDHAAELDVDASRVSIGGESAGGNLTAVVALMCRDRGGPNLMLQVLNVAVVDVRARVAEAAARPGAPSYVAPGGDGADPYASPICAESVAGVAPALVITAEFDPLCEQGEAYGRRLADAGVPTTIRRYDGMIHGFTHFTGKVDEARACREEVIDALRRANSRSADASRSAPAPRPGAARSATPA